MANIRTDLFHRLLANWAFHISTITYSKSFYDMSVEFAMSEISDERYEELRGYLEVWLKRPCTLEEAKEIGDGLIDFYYLLIELKLLILVAL